MNANLRGRVRKLESRRGAASRTCSCGRGAGAMLRLIRPSRTFTPDLTISCSRCETAPVTLGDLNHRRARQSARRDQGRFGTACRGSRTVLRTGHVADRLPGAQSASQSRSRRLDQRTALPNQCLHSAEAAMRLPRRKSGLTQFGRRMESRRALTSSRFIDFM